MEDADKKQNSKTGKQRQEQSCYVWRHKAIAVLLPSVLTLALMAYMGCDWASEMSGLATLRKMRRLQADPRVCRVCVHNYASIPLQWQLVADRSKFISATYPKDQTRCIDGSQVHASWNRELRCLYRDGIWKACVGPSYRYSSRSTLQGNYECLGQ